MSVDLRFPKKIVFPLKTKLFQKENDGTLLRFSDFRSAKKKSSARKFFPPLAQSEAVLVLVERLKS